MHKLIFIISHLLFPNHFSYLFLPLKNPLQETMYNHTQCIVIENIKEQLKNLLTRLTVNRLHRIYHKRSLFKTETKTRLKDIYYCTHKVK